MSLGMMAGMMVDCTRLEPVTDGADSLLGRPMAWTDGEGFRALFIKAADGETHTAERQAESAQYTVIVERGVALEYGAVFRRETDGLTFRCTQPTRDWEAPELSTVAIARCGAERWDLP